MWHATNKYVSNTINLFLFKKKNRVKFNITCLWLITIPIDYYVFPIFVVYQNSTYPWITFLIETDFSHNDAVFWQYSSSNFVER